MSVGLCLVFDDPDFDPELPSDGALLMENLEALEELAELVGATPLTRFGDDREVPEDFDGGPEELDELLGPFDEWFAAEQGATALRALASALEASDDQDAFVEPTELAAELVALAGLLDEAAKHSTKFRLEALF
ncbi:MAG: hypothetical protein R3B72_21225 [Polyangiaceae bacterium]